MRRHLLVLLVVTLAIRGVMLVSFPLTQASYDDNQAAQRFQISELISGNIHIGNIRYASGYPLVMAPLVAFASMLGRMDDRLILLVQVSLSALIPFMVYGIVRGRAGERAALITALIVACDPFGLQAPHFWLPEWWCAFCLVGAMWLLYRSRSRRDAWLHGLLAGAVLGLAFIARYNAAPAIAVIGFSIFALPDATWRWKLNLSLLCAAGIAGLVLCYLLVVHFPAVGAPQLNCISGINQIERITGYGMSVQPENGPTSAEFTRLMQLRTEKEVLFLSDDYPSWQRPGPWATLQEQQAFLNQPPDDPERSTPVSSFTLGYYLGFCPVDQLLRSVFIETIAAQPGQYAVAVLRDMANVLIQNSHVFPTYLLPAQSSYQVGAAGPLGFVKTLSSPDTLTYSGEWIWRPGVLIFEGIMPVVNQLLKIGTPLALVVAVLQRKWFVTTSAVLLMLWVGSNTAVDIAEARLFMLVYPFWGIVLGSGLASLLSWLLAESRRPGIAAGVLRK